jgi:hypothetical protein
VRLHFGLPSLDELPHHTTLMRGTEPSSEVTNLTARIKEIKESSFRRW